MCRTPFRNMVLLSCIFLPLSVGCARKSETAGGPAPNPVGKDKERTLLVFAGAVNKPVLSELAKSFETKAKCAVQLSVSGSGIALSQIDHEKVGDVYVPGSDDFMQRAKEKGAVDPCSERLLAWLVPAINVPKGNPKGIRTLADLARPGLRVGIADANATCLGVVAEQMLRVLGLEGAVKGNVATYPLSCEAIESVLEMGEVDAIIGWDVFEHWAPEKIETVPIPKEVAIRRYISAAVVTYSKQKHLAQQFVDFLASQQGKSAYSKYGYAVPQPGGPLPPTLGR